MLKELEEFIQNNQDDIIVTGGITDEKINDLEESLGLEFRKEIREYFLRDSVGYINMLIWIAY